MASLETTITLDEVIAVAQSRKVPLAPELAGYLALELAESADPYGGAIDPATVFMSDEGTLAIVRLRKEPLDGDAEASIRAILLRLLDAGGAQTPALAAAARRRGDGSLATLVTELEGALIPVNRAAGRRALARLARDARRIALGLGRNAPSAASEGRRPQSRPPRASNEESELDPERSLTAKRAIPAEVMARAASSEPRPEPSREPPRTQVDEPREAHADASAEALAPPTSVAPAVTMRDDVDELLACFAVSDAKPDRELSQDLKAIVGIDGSPLAPPVQQAPVQQAPVQQAPVHQAPVHRPPLATRTDADIEELLAASAAHVPPAAPVPPVDSSPPVSPADAVTREPPSPPTRDDRGRVLLAGSFSDDRQLPTAPSLRRLEDGRPRSRRRGVRGIDVVLVAVAVLALGGGAAALFLLKPGTLSGRTQERVAAERAAFEAEQARAAEARAAASCRAALVVRDIPAASEVLLRVGKAPTDVERMPVGARLEFVALLDGHLPKRAFVPAGATWDEGPDKRPRYELAVQLDPLRKGAPEGWPPVEPGSEVGGRGAPGTVHIVSSPKGAELWLLAGVGPEARIEQLRCTDAVELLVAGPALPRRRFRVSPEDFKPTAGATGTEGAATSVRLATVSGTAAVSGSAGAAPPPSAPNGTTRDRP